MNKQAAEPESPHSDPTSALPDRAATGTRSRILSGIAWNTTFQLFGIALNFVVMLITVRLISPAEFGRVATVTGILGFINVFNCEAFISHAIQLSENHKPDWSSYWSLAVWQQLVLFGICNLVAASLWLLPTYSKIAPLLHIASLGLLWDSASRLRANMLRRDLDFLRLRILSAVCGLASAAVTLILAWRGYGAIALVMGGYVFFSVPMVIELFWIRHWKPVNGWLPSIRLDSLRSILSFGFHQGSVGALAMGRGVLEAAVIPTVIGYTGFGLWNRAQVLFQTSSGRAVNIIADTAYPALPRSRSDQARYRRHATLFAQVVVGMAIFGVFYIGTNGILLSRVLYGIKWVDADPLILPATIFGFGSVVLIVCGDVLLAANSLRKRFIAIFAQAIVGILAIAVLAYRSQIIVYSWVAALFQAIAALLSLLLAAEYFESDWFRRVCAIPTIAAFAGAAACMSMQQMLGWPIGEELVLNTFGYGVVTLVVLRFCFSSYVRDSLKLLPKGEKLARLARLPELAPK